MTPPGTVVAPPSSFVIRRSGEAVIGVVSPSELSPGVGSLPPQPSSAISAVTAICVTPTGNRLSISRAKITVPLPPPATAPTVKVQTLPGELSGAAVQPAVPAPGLKLELAGTMAVISTPEACWDPLLL